MDCSLFVEKDGVKCKACIQYRKTLNVLTKRFEHRGELKCTTNYRYLTGEKCDRLRELQHQNRLSQKQLSRLKLKIEQMTSSRGVNLDDET